MIRRVGLDPINHFRSKSLWLQINSNLFNRLLFVGFGAFVIESN